MKLSHFLVIPLFSLRLLAVPADDHFRAGQSALADELWDVAAIHFSALLESKALSPEDKSSVAIHLAEAWIRDGEPKRALDLLSESFAAGAPGFHFWKGQALTGLGRLSEAVDEFSKELENSTSTYHTETALTRSSLLFALNRPDHALEGLRPLAASQDPMISVEARLREVEILLDLHRYPQARETMPEISEVPSRLLPHAEFLEACLLLSEKQLAEAAGRFAALLAKPTGQSLTRYHSAALGLADALNLQGDPSRASDSLLDFVQQHPDSPLLDAIFRRLVEWLPAQPAANHPVLERLTQWIPAPTLPFPSSGLISTESFSPVSSWPVITPQEDLAAYALYTRAVGIHRVPTPAAKAEASRLMARLRLEYPEHPLVPRSLLQIARWSLENGDMERAFAILDSLRGNSRFPTLAGEAAFIEGKAAYEKGDLDSSIRLFDEAASSLTGVAAESSELNAVFARFRKGEVMTIAAGGAEAKAIANPSLQADLELEQALSATPVSEALVAIENFLTKYPKHSRVPEARLAAAEAALNSTPPDLSLAKAQLDTIAADPATAQNLNPARLALARLKLVDLSNDPPATIEAARSFIKAFPNDPSKAEAELTLGRALYKSESYVEARLVFEKLAFTDTNSERAQAAWFLAARSAAFVAIPSSKEEALTLFDKAIAAKGPLTPAIMMEKAALMITLNRLPEATAFLRKWYDSLSPTDPLRIPAGLLYGEAIYAQGSKNASSLTEALAIYDQLLKHPATTPAFVNRIQYLRGMTLEQLPDETNPNLKREGHALAAYYSVLENSSNPPPEWHYLELSGFRALEILEKAKKWTTAISIAKRIATFKGPRAEEATNRAKQIQLKNNIWDD